MNDELSELRAALEEIDDLESTIALLDWDQNTFVPSGGVDARARQIATLSRLVHARWSSREMADRIGSLERKANGLDEASMQSGLIRCARREHDRATRVPAELVSEMRRHFAATYSEWAVARSDNDFGRVCPLIDKSIELSRRYADCFEGHDHPMDALIDRHDRGMTTERVQALFAELRGELVPLVRTITACEPPRRDLLTRDYPADRQLAFTTETVAALGYDFDCGRQDLTVHPFTVRIAQGDVRITTRINDRDLSESLYASIHEHGHAVYEQNIAPALAGTPLSNGVSAGVHESQSRLWENLVGRSRPFCEWLFPRLEERFPAQLADGDIDGFYRAVNRVERSLVRVEADEVTYDLHIMIRFELERAMLAGELRAKDLPAAWAARYAEDLGVTVPSDKLGVLQDVHWYCEAIGGAFQGYTLGNVMSAQFFGAACRAHPDIPAGFARGHFAPLLAWLTTHIYTHGAIIDPAALVERATGEPLSIEPYMTYLRDKYGALYGF